MPAWVLPVALAAGSALIQNQQNKQIARQNKAQGLAAAAQTQFSPYTGMGAGSYNPKSEGSEIGAALQGALMGASFSGAGEAKAANGATEGAKVAQAQTLDSANGNMIAAPTTAPEKTQYFMADSSGNELPAGIGRPTPAAPDYSTAVANDIVYADPLGSPASSIQNMPKDDLLEWQRLRLENPYHGKSSYAYKAPSNQSGFSPYSLASR
jgi:hypothetical protein